MLIRYEIKNNYKKIILLLIINALLLTLSLAKINSFAQATDIMDIMNQFPKIIKAVFGFNDFNPTTISGIYMIMLLYTSLIFSFFSISLGTKITSKGDKNKIDFVYTTTIKRNKVVLKRILAGIINITILTFINCLLSIIILLIFKETNYLYLVLSNIMLYLALIIIFGLGLLIGSLSQNYKKSSTYCAILIIIFYFCDVIGNCYDSVSFLNYLSPLYYCMNKLLLNNQINYIFLGISIPLVLILFTLSTTIFNKKDL